MQGSDKSSDTKDPHPRPLTCAEYAQEFLRRNPRYRAVYRKVARTLDQTAPEQEVMARRWGLSFPVSARQAGDGGARALASIRLPGHHHPRCRALALRPLSPEA